MSVKRVTARPTISRAAVHAWVVLLAAAAVAAAGDVKVTAKAATDQVSVGQRFIVTVQASGPPGTTWVFPREPGNEKVTLRPAPTPAPGGSAFAYEAAAFAVDEVAVPPITVKYRLSDGHEGEASSDPLPLTIVSLLPKGEAERTLAEIRGPVKLPLGAWFWGELAVLAGLAAVVIALLLRRRRPATATAAKEPEIPADVEAIAALDALAGSELLAGPDFKPFYVALAEVAKRYLERRLAAPVLEMTSSEAVAFLRDSVPGRDFAPSLRDLLAAADTVKFARGHAERAIAERHMAAVRAMVTALEARLRPQEQPQAPLEKSA